MKILILGGVRNEITQRDREYYAEYIQFFKKSAALSSQSTEIQSAMIGGLIIQVGDGEFAIRDTYNNVPLETYDVIFLRGDGFRSYMDIPATIDAFTRLHGVRLINEYDSVRDSSKLLQAVNFFRNDIPVAKTLMVTEAVFAKPEQYTWQFPCVMKATRGSKGNDNFVVNSMEEVRKILDEKSPKPFVLQRFAPNDCDYRVLIVGNETRAIKRVASGESHLNNTSKGGYAEMTDRSELPESVYVQSKRIMDDLAMTIAGIDVLFDKDTKQYMFLEVNAQPQLMSGAFIDEKEKLMGKLLDQLHDER